MGSRGEHAPTQSKYRLSVLFRSRMCGLQSGQNAIFRVTSGLPVIQQQPKIPNAFNLATGISQVAQCSAARGAPQNDLQEIPDGW